MVKRGRQQRMSDELCDSFRLIFIQHVIKISTLSANCYKFAPLLNKFSNSCKKCAKILKLVLKCAVSKIKFWNHRSKWFKVNLKFDYLI